ncbi:hypothetical protein INT45_013458 [Circinella minor]|uniref:Tc1-like transposase DDE domain-containing protein n=1 Tax=Circinella minor TaxID=1195481 RepID=A0A8H7VBL1_9FUNG|nr:hypothetical protein INT45_013458 [Circinella minor]
MNSNNANTSDLTRVAVPDEDTDMEATNHEIDAEPSSYQVACFPTDHTHLVQAIDGIDNTTIDDSSSSSSSESDSDDEPHLVSILPDTPSLENPVPSHAVKKKKKQVRKPANPCEKYTPHSSDLMKQSLFLKLCGHSNKEVSNMLNIPEATIRDHCNRHQNRDGNAEPTRQKRSSSSKITEAGSQFLIQTVTSANTLTLQQLQQQYFKKFDLLLASSTIYRHLVKKCRITIKRAHPYPQRRTDDVTKDRRVTFIKDYIYSGIADYQKNCVFVDETPINGNMKRNYGWASVNQAAHVHVPQMYSCPCTMLAAISYIGLIEVCLKINKVGKGGGTKTNDYFAFLNCVMDCLDEKSLKDKGWNIVCNNAPIHMAHYVQSGVQKRDYRLVLLPHYSPFLNPIETFFSKVKLLYRHVEAES